MNKAKIDLSSLVLAKSSTDEPLREGAESVFVFKLPGLKCIRLLRKINEIGGAHLNEQLNFGKLLSENNVSWRNVNVTGESFPRGWFYTGLNGWPLNNKGFELPVYSKVIIVLPDPRQCALEIFRRKNKNCNESEIEGLVLDSARYVQRQLRGLRENILQRDDLDVLILRAEEYEDAEVVATPVLSFLSGLEKEIPTIQGELLEPSNNLGLLGDDLVYRLNEILHLESRNFGYSLSPVISEIIREKMGFEDWVPTDDAFLKKSEIELHNDLHTFRSEVDINVNTICKQKALRIQSLNAAFEKHGGLKGRILDVGAGDGWCSGYILSNYDIDRAYVMEIDDAAVQSLIPRTLSAFHVDPKKVTIVKGSFNSIPYEKYFDCVIAMGALHHTSNLYQTMRSLYRCLKPGGRLFAQEPAMSNNTPNSFYHERAAKITTFENGKSMRNSNRGDTIYRECEYICAGFHVGFDMIIEKLTHESEKGHPNSVFMVGEKTIGQGFPVTAWEQEF